ncbi:unnamed protein product, partial [Durusdinium trenchii]
AGLATPDQDCRFERRWGHLDLFAFRLRCWNAVEDCSGALRRETPACRGPRPSFPMRFWVSSNGHTAGVTRSNSCSTSPVKVATKVPPWHPTARPSQPVDKAAAGIGRCGF